MVAGNPTTDTPAMTPTEAELALKASFNLSLLLFFADTDMTGNILKRQARNSFPEVQDQLRQRRRDLEEGQRCIQKGIFSFFCILASANYKSLVRGQANSPGTVAGETTPSTKR
jgi:malate synthase